MKLTPLDIRHKDFKRGMRGYVDTEVDTFLDEIADEFERLFKENIELSERCEVLQEKIDHYRSLEDTLQKTLVSAQRSAEELKMNAQKEAQLILHEAELKARQMVNESYADKQGIEKQLVVMRSSEEDFRFRFRSLLEGYLNQLGSIDEAAGKEGGLAGQAEEIKRTLAAEQPPAAAARPRPPAPQAPPAVVEVVQPPASVADPAPPPPAAHPIHEAPAVPEPVAPSPALDEPDDLLADVESEVDDNEFKW
jgi:cell division initiation protein